MPFDLLGDGPDNYVDFTKTGNVSTGGEQELTITAGASLPNQVNILVKTISWSIRTYGFTCGTWSSGPHTNYVTYGTPTGTPPTEKRVSWVCSTASGATTTAAAANSLHTALVDYFDLHYFVFDYYSTAWEVLAAVRGYDCLSLSCCMFDGLEMLGISGPSIQFVYGSSDSACTSEEQRTCPGGTHGLETVKIYAGDWNNYFANCVLGGIWYPGGVGGTWSSALSELRSILAVQGQYQAWKWGTPPASCTNPGPHPVPSP